MIELARDALQYTVGGNVFPDPHAVLSRIPAGNAVALPSGFKYSIATLVAHADFWQRFWSASLFGERAPDIAEDWREPTAGEWPTVRSEFLGGLDSLIRLAVAEPFEHRMKSDAAACRRLMLIAEHNSFHIGQIVLVKRALRVQKGG